MYYYLYQAIWQSNKSVYLMLSPWRTSIIKILPFHYSTMATKELKFAISRFLVMFTE